MGGRVYDPDLGRFISADPTIQYPEVQQNFNRYTYVNNNPLSYTDPSGFGFLSSIFKAIGKIIGGVVKAVVGVVKAVLNSPILRTVAAIAIAAIPGVGAPLSAQLLAGFGAGFVASGGDLKAGLIGAITFGAASTGSILTQSIAGGVSSKLQGRKFLTGFLSAGAFAYVGSQIKQGINDWQQGRGTFYQVSAGKGGVAKPTFGGGVTDRLFVNGILSDVNAAAQRGLEQFHGQSFTLFHNPSNGIFADLTESLLGKVTGTSSLSRQLAGVIKNSGLGITGTGSLVAHSQGGIIVTNALNHLASQGTNNAINLSVGFNGAAIHQSAARSAVNRVGGTLSAFNAHNFDLVPNVIGGNAITNPFKFVGSILASPTLFMGPRFSQHTVYQ